MNREKYLELSRSLPFQHIADTPTVKYYTDWKAFEERLGLPYSERELELPHYLSHLKAHVKLGKGVSYARAEGVEVSESPKDPFSFIQVSDKMTAYHAARWGAGAHLELRGDFGNLFILSIGGESYMGHHVTLRVAQGSLGNIYILDVLPLGRNMKTFLFEGVVEERAKVGVHLLSVHSHESVAFTAGKLLVHDEAEVESRSLLAGGKMSRVQVDYVVKGKEAKLKALASSVARKDTRADFILNSYNVGAYSDVAVNGRGAALNKGYLSFRGSAIVEESAYQASSEIELQVVMIGEEARGFAVPVLEIHSGDVAKGNHSAGISHIAHDHLFYLRSRGLSREDAERLMVSGILSYSGLAEELGIEPMELLAEA
ncbi:MAG: SufD family Fe-S cluster assembly protein [Acidilobaceae archaeon]|nr:SufD family Fe-S cluster assembly protein [Acidilobaceae archaeon]MCX8165027.1 SufD family Fe-S cluster assembly protein [Acidilobaceae archaeon]MDW7974456.1 SufD family Fe-S cluster assembly protein [Sulfolobales archaeon]